MKEKYPTAPADHIGYAELAQDILKLNRPDKASMKESIIEALRSYEALITKAQALAERWVKAQSEYGYFASSPKIDLKQDKILFFKGCVDGIGQNCSMPLNYLFDDTGLEAAAKEQYRVFSETRNRLLQEKLEAEKISRPLKEIEARLQTQTFDNPEGQPCLNYATHGYWDGVRGFC